MVILKQRTLTEAIVALGCILLAVSAAPWWRSYPPADFLVGYWGVTPWRTSALWSGAVVAGVAASAVAVLTRPGRRRFLLSALLGLLGLVLIAPPGLDGRPCPCGVVLPEGRGVLLQGYTGLLLGWGRVVAAVALAAQTTLAIIAWRSAP